MNGQAFYYLASAIVGIALGAATIAANAGQDQDRSIVCDHPGCGDGQSVELACDNPGCGEQTIELACDSPSCGEQTIELACSSPSCSDDQTVPKTV